MFKKIISFNFILLFALISFINIKADNSIEVVATINKVETKFMINASRNFEIKYDDRDKKINFYENSTLKKTLEFKTNGDKISFNGDKDVDINIRGSRSYHNYNDSIISNFEIIFLDKDKFEFNYDDKKEYSDLDYFEIFVSFSKRAAISGEDLVITNVDKPYTTEEIIEYANITAIDEYDGNLTDSITYDDKNYIENKHKIGTYQIKFSVKNSSNKTTEYILNVQVVDFKAPEIDGPTKLEYSYTSNITKEDIKSNYTVSDNYDKDVDLEVDLNNSNFKIPGTYEIILKAEDSSKNKTEEKIQIVIKDDVKPAINDENVGVITINYKDKITDELLLIGLSANDEIDGDLTNKIKVVKNDIGKELKEYTVKYEVSDKAGNITTYTRIYKVISEDLPIFYVSKNVLTIEDVNSMSIDQIIYLLTKLNKIEVDSYEVLTNEYENNENIPGTYKLSVIVKDNFGNERIIEKNIKVFNKSEINNSHSKTSKYLYILTLIPLATVGLVVYRKKK